MRVYLYLIVSTLIIVSCNSKEGSEDSEQWLGESSTITESGLEYTFTNNGVGPQVAAGKEISTHCILKVGDSLEVWSTREDQQTFDFIYKQDPMIPGFVEMVSYMKEGDRVKVIIPPGLGYGDRGAGEDIPPNAVLSFDIEILKVREPRVPASEVLFEKFVSDGKDNALEYYNSEIKVNPDTYDFSERQLFLLAQNLRNDGRLNDFVSVLELTTIEYPESAGAFYRLAAAYADQGRKEEAEAAVDQSLALDPNNPAAMSLKETL